MDKEKNDIIGKKYNKLTAIKKINDGKSDSRYLFKCDCGKEKIILKRNVISGKTKSCGCISVEKTINRCFKDITNKKHGRLLPLSYFRKGNKIYWHCLCDCGMTTDVQSSKLISGKIVSCGCYRKEHLKDIGDLNRSHDKSNTRLYKIYSKMKSRCNNPNISNYNRYGGRGISVCQEWLDDFMAFYEWSIKNGYSDDLSIDRINNDGNYEPCNCRWVTIKEQANNRSTSRYIDVNGQMFTVAQFSEIYNIKSQIFITRRLDKGFNYKQILEDYNKLKGCDDNEVFD